MRERTKWLMLVIMIVAGGFALQGKLALAGESGAERGGSALAASIAADRFAMIKRLQGEWVRIGDDGRPTWEVVSIYRVTAGGSAVEETLFPGTEHEMVTLYHLDGSDLVLTHYCVNGNQPRMRAKPETKDGTLVFECAGGGNMASENDKHMHGAVIVWLDDDRISSEWQEYTDGEPSHTASFNLVRKER